MPKEPQGKNLRAIPQKDANKAALRQSAELAQCLESESPEITTLKGYSYSTTTAATHTLSKPLLVTSGHGEIKSQRCGLLCMQTYAEDIEFLYLDNIYDLGDDHGEGLTSSFSRRSVFFAFYGGHAWTNLNSATLGCSLLQREEHDQADEAPSHREKDTNETSRSVDEVHDIEMIRYVPEHHALHQGSLEQERRTQDRSQQERERQEQLGQERQEQREQQERREQKERLDEASIGEAVNRGTQIGLNKLLCDSLYNTFLTSGNDNEELPSKGNQEPKGALNKAAAPRQRNKEDTTRLTALSPPTQEVSNATKVRVLFKIWQRGNWRHMSDPVVDQSDPSEIERAANQNMKQKIRPSQTLLGISRMGLESVGE